MKQFTFNVGIVGTLLLLFELQGLSCQQESRAAIKRQPQLMLGKCQMIKKLKWFICCRWEMRMQS